MDTTRTAPGATSNLPARWNPLGPPPEDPYPGYAELRASGPLCRAGPATYAVTRHRDIKALLQDPLVGHEVPESLRGQFSSASAAPNPLPNIVSVLGPPAHTRVRRLMSRALGPAVVRRLREVIEAATDELLDRALDRGGLDVVSELAFPLQVRIACDLIGVPAADRAAVCGRAVELGRALIIVPFVDPGLGSGAEQSRWLREYVVRLVAERRRSPAADLTSYLIAARDGEDRLRDDEIADNLVFLLFAGFETSLHMVAGGCATLLAFPDQLARLRADRSLLGGAVEELLRYDPPIQWIARMTAEPVEIGGRPVRAGRFLLLLLGSANRDEQRFADPDRLDIGRHPNRHLSFAGGAHHCLGVLLARTQGAVVLDRLLTRCASLEPAGPPVRRLHPNLRGLAALPVAVTPA